MPAAERQRETGNVWLVYHPAVRGQPAGYRSDARTRKGADVDQVSL
jgi:hypothetical protein